MARRKQEITYVEYCGKQYPVKEHNGYRFSVEELDMLVYAMNGDHPDKDAERIDNRIAYYFDADTFARHTGAELYKLAYRV